MNLAKKLTEEDLEDPSHLLRPRWYWLRCLGEHWHGAAFIAAVAWSTIVALSGNVNFNWWAVGG